MYVEPLRDSEGIVQGTVGVALDVTPLKEAQRATAQLNSELEGRVRERTAELGRRNRELGQERRLLLRLLELQRRERELVSYEIHDGLVQSMTASTMFLEAARHKLAALGESAGLPPAIEQNLETGLRLVRESVQEARRLIEGLRPPVLEEQGLVAAVEGLVDELHMLKQQPIEVTFEHQLEFERIAPAVELAVFRIVQEALSNVKKHSQAARALVRLEQEGDELLITVRDWGVGFEPEKVRPKHYGLIGVQERARLLGGEAEVISRPGKGTTIRVRLSLVDAMLPNVNDLPADSDSEE